jgi:hypothetical protein
MNRALLTCILPLAFCGCARGADAVGRAADVEEVARVASPDSAVDAVLTRTNTHATADFVHRIYIVPRGERLNEGRGHELFRADHVDSLAVAWNAPRRLEVRYARARIFSFTNFWNSAAVRDYGYTVEIRLHPTRASQLRP